MMPPELIEQRKALARALMMPGAMSAGEREKGLGLWLRLQMLERPELPPPDDSAEDEAQALRTVRRLCPTGRLNVTDWVAADAGMQRPAARAYAGEESDDDAH